MKAVTSLTFSLAAAVLIVIANSAIAAAQAGSDTCVGLNATLGGTCTPLTNPSSGSKSNTALGSGALESNTVGYQNTAIGEGALSSNTLGYQNTAVGYQALFINTFGTYDTAIGLNALHSNTTGQFDTATGAGALDSNTAGAYNTAIGNNSLLSNTTGQFNAATGAGALNANVSGEENTAIGYGALSSNTMGSINIAIGGDAGGHLTTGDNNIDIGNVGVAAEANTIRIGTQETQTDTYIAGIFGTPKIKKACEVVVESTGLLGCVKSSARYKRDIRDMGDASAKLMNLRPVTFRYKADSTGVPQYGLIAEEVEKVYPELVVDGDHGEAETVAYQVLPAMLLNEVQKQSRQLARKDAQIAAMQRQLVALQQKNREIDAIAERLDALERDARVSRPSRQTAALR
jgi:polyhydroxyalkanoate synthesis regulator phasin